MEYLLIGGSFSMAVAFLFLVPLVRPIAVVTAAIGLLYASAFTPMPFLRFISPYVFPFGMGGILILLGVAVSAGATYFAARERTSASIDQR